MLDCTAAQSMHGPVDDHCLNRLFRAARTCNTWKNIPVPEALLRHVYALAKLGPTSANCCPARFVFLQTETAKLRLAPHLSAANRTKSLTAPVITIVAYDRDFAKKMPILFPHNQTASSWFSAPHVAESTACRNSSLQGAYLMLAARALGLDCGPMSGFDNAGVDREFFSGTNWVSNFLCNIGYGEQQESFPRLPRLEFEDACLTF